LDSAGGRMCSGLRSKKAPLVGERMVQGTRGVSVDFAGAGAGAGRACGSADVRER
jgi:hypothetical protein